MPRKRLDTSVISTTRLNIVAKGYLNKADVMAFVPCGKDKARSIFNEIRDKVKSDGLENCQEVILAKRMLDYMGLKAETIKEAAKLERRGS